MSQQSHELTPVSPRMPAVITAGTTAGFVALLASVLFLQLWPPMLWDRLDAVARYADLTALWNIYGEAYSAATPPPLFFYGGEDMFTRFAALYRHTGAEIAFLWVFPATLVRDMADVDLVSPFLIHLSGVAATALAAAWPVYRHVRFRTPMVRQAQYVDGPQVVWFGPALRQATSFLAPLTRQFPGGIELAPGLTVPQKAELESCFLLGLPGSGKSVILEGITRQAIERNHRALCLDVKGGLVKRITRLVGDGECVAIGLGRDCRVWSIGNRRPGSQGPWVGSRRR